MDKNLSELIKILVSGQVALSAMFHCEPVFVFWRLINKDVLKWFLLVICKEQTLSRLTNLLSRNHPTFCFLIKKSGSADAQYWTAISLNWQKHQFTGKHLCWILFLIKMPAFRLATLLERDSNTGVFLLRNF